MKKIVILSGGTGAEVEIAKKSAEFFKKHLKKDYDYYELPKQLDIFLENKDKYNLAIPVFHGEYGEDGRIFAFLDVLGIKNTFSHYNTHSICLDKYKINTLVESLGINIPNQYLLFRDMDFGNIPNNLVYPLILKPNKGGSSFFTYKIESREELGKMIKKAQKNLEDDIILQKFVVADEYSVSVVNGEILPIMKLEKQHKGDFFDYVSKYESDNFIKETWPNIEKKLEEILKNQSQIIYNFFDLKGFCRIDFLVDGDKVYFLEVNTIPGMTDASILPKSWLLTGKSFEQLVDKIIS